MWHLLSVAIAVTLAFFTMVCGKSTWRTVIMRIVQQNAVEVDSLPEFIVRLRFKLLDFCFLFLPVLFFAVFSFDFLASSHVLIQSRSVMAFIVVLSVFIELSLGHYQQDCTKLNNCSKPLCFWQFYWQCCFTSLPSWLVYLMTNHVFCQNCT